MTWKNAIVMAMAAIAPMSAVSGRARADLVTNGNFEQTINNTGTGELSYNTNLTGWTNNSGYNFLLSSSVADSSGVSGYYGNFKLWGPNDGSSNGLAASPTGGNYVAADGNFGVGAIQQTITGLTKGNTYTLGFWWGAAQQYGFTGVNTDNQWKVSFGSQTQSTALVTNQSKGFTGWMYQTFNFTADGTSDLLSFLASSNSSGAPPFLLLDGVSLTPASVPEPSTMLLMGGGLFVVGAARRMRRKPSVEA